MITLKEIVDSIKITAKAALVTSALTLPGCLGAYLPFRTGSKGPGVYGELGARVSLQVTPKYDVNLGNAIQTTPVHPDDGGPLAGQATTNITTYIAYVWSDPEERPSAMLFLSGGLEGSIGTETVRLRTGVDVRSLLDSEIEDYRRGIFDVEHQPIPFDSYAFTQFVPHTATIPFVGIETTISDTVFLSFDVGFPRSRFHVSSGHDRYGVWAVTQTASWEGYGRSYTIRAGIVDEYIGAFSLSVTKEEYDMQFAGEGASLSSIHVAFECRYRF